MWILGSLAWVGASVAVTSYIVFSIFLFIIPISPQYSPAILIARVVKNTPTNSTHILVGCCKRGQVASRQPVVVFCSCHSTAADLLGCKP